MKISEIELDQIKAALRLREIDQEKVDDLVESIRLVGLLYFRSCATFEYKNKFKEELDVRY